MQNSAMKHTLPIIHLQFQPFFGTIPALTTTIISLCGFRDSDSRPPVKDEY